MGTECQEIAVHVGIFIAQTIVQRTLPVEHCLNADLLLGSLSLSDFWVHIVTDNGVSDSARKDG